jgi:hypothetical protein
MSNWIYWVIAAFLLIMTIDTFFGDDDYDDF